MLARVLREHPDELRADLQEVYGLNIDDMGRSYSTAHAAALLAQLPGGARVRVAYCPDAAWTEDRLLAAASANALNTLVWMRTKDGQRGRNRPRPIGPAGRRRGERRQALAMTVDELDAALSRPRG